MKLKEYYGWAALLLWLFGAGYVIWSTNSGMRANQLEIAANQAAQARVHSRQAPQKVRVEGLGTFASTQEANYALACDDLCRYAPWADGITTATALVLFCVALAAAGAVVWLLAQALLFGKPVAQLHCRSLPLLGALLGLGVVGVKAGLAGGQIDYAQKPVLQLPIRSLVIAFLAGMFTNLAYHYLEQAAKSLLSSKPAPADGNAQQPDAPPSARTASALGSVSQPGL